VIGERPSGAELLDALRAAAAKAGVPLTQFIEPICSSSPANLINQLSRAQRPLQLTIDRVRALIEGGKIPAMRRSNGIYGDRSGNNLSVDHHIASDELERRKRLTQQAHEIRRPGETLASAVQRLGGQA
jgi:hypothetical protein